MQREKDISCPLSIQQADLEASLPEWIPGCTRCTRKIRFQPIIAMIAIMAIHRHRIFLRRRGCSEKHGFGAGNRWYGLRHRRINRRHRESGCRVLPSRSRMVVAVTAMIVPAVLRLHTHVLHECPGLGSASWHSRDLRVH